MGERFRMDWWLCGCNALIIAAFYGRTQSAEDLRVRCLGLAARPKACVRVSRPFTMVVRDFLAEV